MVYRILSVLVFVGVANCIVLMPPSFNEKRMIYTDVPNVPKYTYSYGLKEHNPREITNRMDEYEDDGYFSGVYALQEPDGTVRTMKYVVDKYGQFDAIVTQSHDKPLINRQYNSQYHYEPYYQPISRSKQFVEYEKPQKYHKMITTITPVSENSYKIYIKQPRYIYQ